MSGEVHRAETVPERIEQLARQAAADRLAFERRQNRRRIGFIAVVLVFVWAQSYTGRIHIRDHELDACRRAIAVAHYLRLPAKVRGQRVYDDCDKLFPPTTPWP